MECERVGNRPSSVTWIAVITLIPAVCVLLLLGPAEVELIFLLQTCVFAPVAAVALVLEVYAVAVSILMFVSDSKLVWYSSVIFWVLVIAAGVSFAIYFQAAFTVFFYALAPIVSSGLCLATFQEEPVKKHFGLKLEPKADA